MICRFGEPGEGLSVPEGVRTFDVLVVDDHPDYRDALVQGLESRPEVRVVKWTDNGASAVALAAKFRPHVILMDVKMPGMDGFEATRKIASQVPAIPVILMSGNEAVYVEERAKAAGAKAFIDKGLELSAILEVISKVLGAKP